MFEIKVVEEIKTHILYSLTSPPPPENRALYNIEKYGGVREDANKWRLRVTYWISKPIRAQTHSQARASTHTHIQREKYMMLIAVHGNNGFVNARHCHITLFSSIEGQDLLWGPSNLLFSVCRGLFAGW
jgi:hypothetical protein